MIYAHTHTYKNIQEPNSVIFSVSHTRGSISQSFSVQSVFTFHRILHILSKHVPHHLRTDLSHVQLLREPAAGRQAGLLSVSFTSVI